MGRPRKIKRPVGLDAALRHILSKKRPEDRMKIFREWRRTILRAELKREPTDQETEAQIKLFREPDFDAADCAFGFWDLLNDYVPIFHAENRRKRARIAADIRWSKENRGRQK